MSSSSRIEKLPSSYSSESAELKVLHKKKINNNNKKNKLKRSFSSFGQFHKKGLGIIIFFLFSPPSQECNESITAIL